MNTDLSKRNSNFELIRIIGMLFIVSSHLAVHGVINTADVVWKDGSAVNKLFSSGLMAGGGDRSCAVCNAYRVFSYL
ncbi:hypothetical protein NE568_13795 [[Eubacterium] rectale]|nr:hypothetical protein [Agathobacter rectalis]MCQ4890923.1 hypothetical protein [Agathobacter rectalis]MCQ4930899.1 hypothetical protein [Agathobacter rectalis]